ncbi:hypothetical protein J5N97_024340 [Dioscorea zingiberensis]|uniref:Uncharacterized protein n=1 Tax=Dioscorea zingiberensis TaxID=325984 RepID=A0A9D5C719_9LILI|nr:hypothetical protein J5N97_024340 [Dioscorea zingiberensis]
MAIGLLIKRECFSSSSGSKTQGFGSIQEGITVYCGGALFYLSQEPVVVDISSDEEDFNSFSRKHAILLLTGSLSSFECVDGDGEQSDDIMVLDELSTAPVPKEKNSSTTRLAVLPNEGSDDDCLVLDSDPDKIVSATNDKEDVDESDELLVVGEKGQVACRDYPHSRHLCANFPFSTTPHERHCSLCHCYVCDLPAPCGYWGDGLSSTNHCHSTDKECPNSISRISQHNPVPRSIPSSNTHLQACSITKIATANPPRQRHHHRPLAFPNCSRRHPAIKLKPSFLQMAPAQREKLSVAPSNMQTCLRFKKPRTAGSDSISMGSLHLQSSICDLDRPYSGTSEKAKCAMTVSEKDTTVLDWQEILANVASELEVSVPDSGTSGGQPQEVFSKPLSLEDLLLPQPNEGHNITNLCQHSIPTNTKPNTCQNTTNNEPNSLGIDCNYIFGDAVHDSQPMTVPESNPPATVNNGPVPSDPHLGNVFASLEDITPNTAVDVDPLSLFTDVDIMWNRLAEL